MGVLFEGTVHGINSKVDGSWKVTLETGELTGQMIGDISQLRNKHVKIYMTKDNVTTDHVEEIDKMEIIAPETKQKSAHLRMRSMLYRLWMQDKEDVEVFNDFYNMKMDHMITFVENKLG